MVTLVVKLVSSAPSHAAVAVGCHSKKLLVSSAPSHAAVAVGCHSKKLIN